MATGLAEATLDGAIKVAGDFLAQILYVPDIASKTILSSPTNLRTE